MFLSSVEETDHILKDQERTSIGGVKYPMIPFVFSKPRKEGPNFVLDNISYNT